MAVDIHKHSLVPKHSLVSETEKGKVLERFKITTKELPKISIDDPAIGKLKVKLGDIVKVQRESKTAGVATYYRVVAE